MLAGGSQLLSRFFLLGLCGGIGWDCFVVGEGFLGEEVGDGALEYFREFVQVIDVVFGAAALGFDFAHEVAFHTNQVGKVFSGKFPLLSFILHFICDIAV
jgi:hypothetical protein